MPVHQFTYKKFQDESELDAGLLKLLIAAREATTHAYAPYSKFKVGAAVLLGDGTVVPGVNIENASYPVGICAERSALAAAISGHPGQKITAIAISYISSQGTNDKAAFPCGMCRQFIAECEDRNQEPITLVLAAMQGNIFVIDSAKDLLPFSFGGKDLD
jgi:cytidine deaminase